MEENTNEAPVVEEAEEVETPEADLTPETDWEAEAKKARGIAQRLRTKLTKAEEKKKEVVVPTTEPVKETQKTGELHETQLDYLDLKGVTEGEDIDVIQKVMQRTGQTVRQALKDDYVVTKLAALKAERDVKSATPSSTRRSGASTNDIDYWKAKFEQDGTLPDDFELRAKVVDSKYDTLSNNKPAWRR